MPPVLGIDLGTFNSCVAIVERGEPVVLADRGGNVTVPSVVALTENRRRLVGRVAKRQAVTNAENTVYAAKRLIGRKWSSEQVQRMVQSVAYRIVEGPHNDPRISLLDRELSVPEISAILLREMKLIAEEYLGEIVEQAVVTVPAYFNDGQRQATRDAGAIAGLEVLQILNEPTAAALAYGFGKQVDRTIAVYDLGGGTFDVSIMELSSAGVFKVIATSGDTFLGGEDFDQRVIELLMREVSASYGVDLRRNRMAVQRIRDAAESAKCELSSRDESEVNLPFITTSADGQPVHVTRAIRRAELEDLTRDLVLRSIELTASTLEEAGLERGDIDDVILVGGMTRMPLVQRAVHDFFGRPPNVDVNPDLVVALGAAIQGAALAEDDHDMVLLDVTPHTLGIVVAGGHMEELIPQNSTVPIARGKVFTTVRDNQTTVKILVVQGESRRADENELLGEFAMTDLRRGPAGALELEVTFELDMDGIVKVRARDLETHQMQSIQITASSGLTEDELTEMISDAERHALTRKADEAEERTLAQAGELILAIERLSAQVLRAVEGSDYARQSVEESLATVADTKDQLRAKDLTALNAAMPKLQRILKLFQGTAASTG